MVNFTANLWKVKNIKIYVILTSIESISFILTIDDANQLFFKQSVHNLQRIYYLRASSSLKLGFDGCYPRNNVSQLD